VPPPYQCHQQWIFFVSNPVYISNLTDFLFCDQAEEVLYFWSRLR
jgi:hypothetical protein